MPEESSSEEEEADDDDGNVEFVYGPPKERKTSLSSSPPTVKPTVRRTKRGRPSKSELVLGQIKVYSIKMTCCSVQIEKRSHRLNQPQRKPVSNYLTSIFDQNFDRSKVPSLSGIPKSTNTHEEKKTFVPLPIPTLDADGNITDKEYISKYFDGVDPAKFKRRQVCGRKSILLRRARRIL